MKDIQDRNPKARTEVITMGDHGSYMEDHGSCHGGSWLTGLFPKACSASFLKQLRTTHSKLDPSTSILNQENTPQTHLQASLMEIFS